MAGVDRLTVQTLGGWRTPAMVHQVGIASENQETVWPSS